MEQSRGAGQVMQMILVLEAGEIPRAFHPSQHGYNTTSAQESQGADIVLFPCPCMLGGSVRRTRGPRRRACASCWPSSCEMYVHWPATYPRMRRCFCRRRYPKAWEERAADARAKEARLL